MKTKKNLHRGQVLEQAVKNSHVKITQLVKKMGISRGTYYNNINDPELPFELLDKYGKSLNHDFTQDFPDMKKYDSDRNFDPPRTMNEALKQIEYWKGKYIKLLEKVQDNNYKE